MLLFGMASIAVPVAYVFAGYDAPGYILELLADSPYYRSCWTIYVNVLTRLLITTAICQEGFRTGGFLCGIAIILVGKLKTFFHVVFKCQNYRVYHRFYQRFRCMFSSIESELQLLIYFGLSSVFWMLVLFCWICVKFSPSKLPYMVYWIILVFLILSLVISFTLIEQVCKNMEAAVRVVDFYILRMRIVYKRNPTRGSKLDYMHAYSIRPVRIKYGFFGCLGKDFVVSYFGAILTRCFDALILF